MKPTEYVKQLRNFLTAAKTPYHAVAYLETLLINDGFSRLLESSPWVLTPLGKYYVIRNDGSIIAFYLGTKDLADTGIRMAGAHTDSPCLKIKPQPEKTQRSYGQLGVEVYGGALLNPWFDRDLSIAGRVIFRRAGKDKTPKLYKTRIDFSVPVAFIPSLAIHLDREANQNRSINPHLHLPPIFCKVRDSKNPFTAFGDFRKLLLRQINKAHPDAAAAEVLEFDLNLYDTQAPSIIGLKREFLAGGRLDNLLSCFAGIMGLIAREPYQTQTALVILNDHEEVGSTSLSGAHGTFLRSVLQRICQTDEHYYRMIDRSFFISADNAHGVHPNYGDKFDDQHAPLLNQGVVLKINANQKYVTNADQIALLGWLCDTAKIPFQRFVMRSDLACGSTIGPITTSEIGVRAIDIGIPTMGMHSIRELAGVKDCVDLYRILDHYFKVPELPIPLAI